METAYIDYIGSCFEVFFYSDRDRCWFGRYYSMNEARRACKRGRFDKVVIVSNKVK